MIGPDYKSQPAPVFSGHSSHVVFARQPSPMAVAFTKLWSSLTCQVTFTVPNVRTA